jgi:hypothetical protein
VGGLELVEKAKRRLNQGPRSELLQTEQAVYEANRSSWPQDYEGEYVLIKRKTVYGFYDSADLALTAGCSRSGIGPLFVKRDLTT